MLFSLMEILDIIIMTGVVGFIFKDLFRAPSSFTPEGIISMSLRKSGTWNDFWFSALLVAPAIILHELGHKLTAMAFGLTATFHAAYLFLGLGVLLKLVNFGFIFFVPAYVSIMGETAPLNYSLIAFMGPFVNLILWLGSLLLLKYGNIPRKYHRYLGLSVKINMFLFIFNMLPIPEFDGFPGFDGFHVFKGLIQALF
ncbi:M50 family metallopeptidase [Candidatus Woesearchaeota archaeon]|nr:M50 family metallopeptidase [Candidatus Woesearchaeota archaeon]